MTYQTFLLRISISFLLSFIIGFERQLRRRTIGLRTNILVCIGAFLFVTFSIETSASDISRIAAQVVSGIGFLGAGVILKDGNNIKGLNTAATLWCNAAIGTLCAAGLLVEATTGTLFILIANIFIRFITLKLDIIRPKEREDATYIIKVICYEEKEIGIRTIISQNINKENIFLKNLESIDSSSGKVKIKAEITINKKEEYLIEKLMNRITMEPGVVSLGFYKDEDKKQDDLDDEI